MESYHITGGNRLEGELEVNGAKNAVLPILAACLATGKSCRITNCPNLSDVKNMLTILKEIGCKIEYDQKSVVVNSEHIHTFKISEKLMREMRSSVFLMGPMIARFGKITMSYPGGCEIGLRPIDIHISALKQLGVTVNEKEGNIECIGHKLQGTTIALDFPSVGATENAMLTAIGAEGETRIVNAAREPEIVDLQNFLNGCGAKIKGAGSGQIVIKGNPRLQKTGLDETEYSVMTDRIEAGTFLVASAITGGEIILKNIMPENMTMILSKLVESGCKVSAEKDRIFLKGPKKLKAINYINTQPHPGFPTDMQSQMLSMLTLAKGTSIITETIFENRYKNIDQLRKMGAQIIIDGRNAIIKGVAELSGTIVQAKDLRGGAALVIAGLGANGNTVVENIAYIDRGYENFEQRLSLLGAQIVRVK